MAGQTHPICYDRARVDLFLLNPLPGLLPLPREFHEHGEFLGPRVPVTLLAALMVVL